MSTILIESYMIFIDNDITISITKQLLAISENQHRYCVPGL
jgi:hypothetical protein